MRNNELAKYLEQAKRCLVILVFVVSMLAGSLTVTQNVAAASCPAARKIQQWERESRAVVRFSVRLYRFYKLSTERPMAERSSE